MKQWTHVDVRDLDRYRSDPKKVSAERAYTLYGLKRWVGPFGAITEDGKRILRRLDALGDAARLSSRRMQLLMDIVERPGADDVSYSDATPLMDHGLLRKEGDAFVFTETGRAVVELYRE